MTARFSSNQGNMRGRRPRLLCLATAVPTGRRTGRRHVRLIRRGVRRACRSCAIYLQRYAVCCQGVCGSIAACVSHPPWVRDRSAGIRGEVAGRLRPVRKSVRWRRTGGRIDRRPGRTVFINRAIDRKGSKWASINRAIDGFWLTDLLLNCMSLKSRDWRILACLVRPLRYGRTFEIVERKGGKKGG